MARKDPELQSALNEFGDLINRPSSIRKEAAHQSSRPPEEGRPPNLRNVSPNQFALPGMEEHAHPGARHLPKGIAFSTEDWRSGDQHSHYLYAHQMAPDRFDPGTHHGNALGWIQWAGEHSGASQYPGEVEMVERGYGQERHKGLMTDLYRMGHEVNMGQSTVPVHSPSRTAEGEAWSAKVGGPRPARNDFGWQPPTGIHPFEQQAHQSNSDRMQQKNKGQQTLPGMSRQDELWWGMGEGA